MAKSKSLWIDGVVGSQLRDTQGETLSVEGADISELEAGRGRWNDNHGKGFFNSIGRITGAKKIYKADDCDNDRHRYYWDQIKTPFIYAQGYLYDDQEHPNAKAAAAILRNIHKSDVPLKIKASVEGGVVARGIKDPTLLARTKIHSVALTFTPANNATLIEPTNLTKSHYDEAADMELIKSVMHLAETNVPSFRHIARDASADKITANFIKIGEELTKATGLAVLVPNKEQILDHALEQRIAKNIEEIHLLIKAQKEDPAPSHRHDLGAGLFTFTNEHLPKEADKVKEKVFSGADNDEVRRHVADYLHYEQKNPKKALDQLDSTIAKHPKGQRAMSSLFNDSYFSQSIPTNDGHEHNETMGTVLHGTPTHSFTEDQGSLWDRKGGARHLGGNQPEGAVPKQHSEIYEAWMAPNEAKHVGYMRTSAFESPEEFMSKDATGRAMAKEALSRGKQFFVKHKSNPTKQYEITQDHFKALNKALTAGYGGAGAPSDRVGGSVLQAEVLQKPGFKDIVCDKCGKEQILAKHQVRCRDCGHNFSLERLYGAFKGV